MNEIEIKKDLYKSKAMAKFSHYKAGELFYNVELIDGIYQFPISTTEIVEKETLVNINSSEIQGITSIIGKTKLIQLSEDLGETEFANEIKGSELIRWIFKAIKAEKIRKIGIKPNEVQIKEFK